MENHGLFLGLWKHLHWRGERKVCPTSVFWESRQGHNDIAKASPALCLEAPAARKVSWDMAAPQAAPAKGRRGEQGPAAAGARAAVPLLLMQGENGLLLPARPSRGRQPPFLVPLEGGLIFPGMGSSST